MSLPRTTLINKQSRGTRLVLKITCDTTEHAVSIFIYVFLSMRFSSVLIPFSKQCSVTILNEVTMLAAIY